MSLTGLPWTTLVDVPRLAAALVGPSVQVLDARATASTAVRVVDARFSLADPQSGAAQYAAGHIAGALHADLNRDLSDLGRQGHGRHPLPDSDTFAATLGRWGMSQVPEVTALGPYPGRFDMAQVVSADEVQARLAQRPGWLVDARAAERYRGDVEPLDRVAGHVPGALNRPFGMNVHEGRLRPAAELQAELGALLGDQPARETVLMCGSGVTACHLLLAFEHAGLAGARVFADSWSGWSSDPSRPVAVG